MTNNQQQYTDFTKAIEFFGFIPEKLVIEFFTSGANNYVIGLKHENRTWAVSISFPKTENISKEKLKSFLRLEKICSYMTDNFKRGIKIDNNNKFMFDGNCFVCDSVSTKNFIKKLAKIQNYEFLAEIFNYKGVFLVKKGAPSSETLEHNIDFADLMIKSISLLHKQTGVVKLVEKETVKKITKDIIIELNAMMSILEPDEKLKKEIEKYDNKWNKNKNSITKENVMREVLIRSGKKFDEILDKYLDRHKLNLTVHKSFVHGDAHGGNFIVVKKGDIKEVHPIDVEDAVGLNNEEKKHYLFDLIKFTISAYNLSMIFGNPLETDGLIDSYYKNFDLIKISN